MTQVLTVCNLSAGYGRQIVVSRVSFSVAPAEVLVIFGANGAGKSTVVRAITRSARVFAGCVQIGDMDVSRLAPSDIQQLGVGVLPQGRTIFPSLTVRENLLVALRRTRREKASAMIDKIVGEWPEIAPHLGKPAGLLSGGERQILGLCRALVRNPQILILDEPGAGLGPGVLAKLLTRVKESARCDQMAVLVVEQNAEAALSIADTALVLRNGTTVFLGNARDLTVQDLVRLMLGEGAQASGSVPG